jgi:hypothetical protein
LSEAGVFVVTLAEISLAETLEQTIITHQITLQTTKTRGFFQKRLLVKNINKHIYLFSVQYITFIYNKSRLICKPGIYHNELYITHFPGKKAYANMFIITIINKEQDI